MRFAIFTTLFAYATIGLLQLVAASPVLDTKDMVRRDNADIMAAFDKLKSTIAPTLGGINDMVSKNETTLAGATPLVANLKAALSETALELSKLSPASLRKRQSDDEIAQLVAGIVTDITTALDGLLGSAATIPLLGGLLAGVDTSLNQVLLGLSVLLQGVLRLVANLLSNVATLLRNLAFGLSLGTLGL